MVQMIEIEKSVSTRAEMSENVLRVASMFGLGVEEEREEIILPRTGVPVRSGEIVFVTGASGSGKSTILRLLKDEITRRGKGNVIDFDGDIVWGGVGDCATDLPVVDCFGGKKIEDVLRYLSIAGLNDAFVMLRKLSELSDGQKYRFRLAKAICAAEEINDGKVEDNEEADKDEADIVIFADEFGATLDRITAKILAKNVQRWIRKKGKRVCFVAATTHDDLLEAFDADVVIEKGLGGEIGVYEKCEVKR